MKIDSTEFGSITIAGKTYDHDVVIRLSEQVVKRKKKLSKRIYGSSHTVSEDEARFVFEKGCTELIFGTGQYGNAALSPEAAAFLEKKGCRVIAQPTPEAVHTFNACHKPKIGLFHVTC
ncbi:MAG TPA: MTH938/NDUFAF3 family protein [Candidatus Margulisiibacteriota bacterium]|nr:MTH938/NDUFAF3 family protein [Candidatus Margulisiibacteriota bacterium]